jgi:hypothetical protein
MRACALALTASAVTTRPQGLHSNVCIGGKSAWPSVRVNCIASPQHGQATYSLYSRIRLFPRYTKPRTFYQGPSFPARGIVCKIWPINGNKFQPDRLGVAKAVGQAHTMFGM